MAEKGKNPFEDDAVGDDKAKTPQQRDSTATNPFLDEENSDKKHQTEKAQKSGNPFADDLDETDDSNLERKNKPVPKPFHPVDTSTKIDTSRSKKEPDVSDYDTISSDDDLYLLNSHYYESEILDDDDGCFHVAPEKRKQLTILRDLVTICVVFMFEAIAFLPLRTLQPDINQKNGLGAVIMACVAVAAMLSCILAPALINRIGVKTTLVIGWTCNILFAASHFFPNAATMTPAAIMLGFAIGSVLTVQGIYITTFAMEYAEAVGHRFDVILSRFNGFFIMCFGAAIVLGEFIGAVVLHDLNIPPTRNITGTQCGASYCPRKSKALEVPYHKIKPDPKLELIAIFLSFAVAGLILTLFILGKLRREVSMATVNRQLFSVCRMLKDPRMVMLTPLCIYVGMETMFIFAAYAEAYVTCDQGIGWVNLVAMSIGIAITFSSVLSGIIVQYLGRSVVMVITFLVNLALLLKLLMWVPNQGEQATFFTIAVFWGMCDGVWRTQLSSLMGLIYHDNQDAAFANFLLWQAVGFTMAFTFWYVMCIFPLICITLSFLCLGSILYFCVETNVCCVQFEQSQKEEKEGIKSKKPYIDIPPLLPSGATCKEFLGQKLEYINNIVAPPIEKNGAKKEMPQEKATIEKSYGSVKND